MLKLKPSVLLFILTIIVNVSSAQLNRLTSSCQFHSINNFGFLEGQAGSAFQLETINGAQYRSWFGGVGLGLDLYRYRTIPLFIDIRKEFGRSSNKLFLYSDLGINFSWVTDNEKTSYANYDKFSNSFYNDMGFGYKIKVTKNRDLLVSLGYSFKKIIETYNYGLDLNPVYLNIQNIPSNGQSVQTNYSLNRLSIKIGWTF
jgi:hypothetical protein